MNYDKQSVIAYMLNKKIISITPHTASDGSSKITNKIHIPIPGEIERSSHYRIILNNNYELYYLIN